MAYMHQGHQFTTDHRQQMFYHPQMAYNPYPPQPQHFDTYYPGYHYTEYADFGPAGFTEDGFDEAGEISTRPRLTREQVEVLESQFQAHPKPNSQVKRQLAMQTKLTMPRVANWFQNRRAKAKQQKKQEEYGGTQAIDNHQAWKSEDNLAVLREDDIRAKNASITSFRPAINIPKTTAREGFRTDAATSLQDPVTDAGYASLQRALTAAHAAQAHQVHVQDREHAMPPPAMPLSAGQIPLATRTVRKPLPESDLASMLPEAVEMFGSWSSTPVPEIIPFDFGFDQPPKADEHAMTTQHDFEVGELSTQTSFSSCQEAWREPQQTPTFPRQMSEGLVLSQSPSIPLQNYSASRRGSTTEELASNFGTFALAGTPPVPSQFSDMRTLEPSRSPEGEVDLAARRKRPRPAALGTASLRSRSYGALTTKSPTMRPSSSMSSPHTIRHVKSMGQGLNVRYAGIRKPSSAQRSPFNISTFAEAEAFNSLMAQKTIAVHMQEDYSPTSPFKSPEMLGSTPMSQADSTPHALAAQIPEASTQYTHYTTHQLHPSMTSPPSTPFRTEFMYPHSIQTMAPPSAAHSQYASAYDYTPPYSAGPLTNSSWSDAPLASPEPQNLGQYSHLPNTAFMEHADHAFSYSRFMMPPEPKAEHAAGIYPDSRKTEFFIQEFPGQKEEHAAVAQQLAPQKPKNYVFANTSSTDFGG